MQIELIKLKIDDDYVYKYKPFKYCCEDIQKNKCVILKDDDLIIPSIDCTDEYIDENDLFIPHFCTFRVETISSYEDASWSDEFEKIESYPIQFCPHCGERIDIRIVDEIDVSEEYDKLSKLRTVLWRKSNKIDSKQKSDELANKIREIDKQIFWFYELGEYKKCETELLKIR